MRKKKSEPLAAFDQEAFDWPVKESEALIHIEEDLHPDQAEEEDIALGEVEDEEQESFVRRARVTMIGRVTGWRTNYKSSQFKLL